MHGAPSRARLRLALVAPAAAVLAAGCGGTGASHKVALVAASAPPAAPLVVAAPSTPSEPARLALPDVLAGPSVRVPILMYHRIDRRGPHDPPLLAALTVSPTAFARQMRWLVANRFHAITQRQLYDALVRGAVLPSRPVLITFDDGYADVYRNALPVLRRDHLHATVYVITDRVSTHLHRFLTWGELRALEAGGVEIGSHTHSHVDLTTLDDAGVLDELMRSRRLLERHLGHPVQWLAYPAGRVDARVERIARRAGYVLAMATVPGFTQSPSDPLRLERIRVFDESSLAGLGLLRREPG
jgi:peptidoglycan/xylan/chitin deacetylase (PgdA/CDA1 family)